MRAPTGTVAALMLAMALLAATVAAQPGAADGEWRSYAADAWGTKYSPLDQITADNFNDLELAWRWRTADSHLPHDSGRGIRWCRPRRCSTGSRRRRRTAG